MVVTDLGCPLFLPFFYSSSHNRSSLSLVWHIWAWDPGPANHNSQGWWCDPGWVNQSSVELPAIVVAKDCLSPQCHEAEGDMILEPLVRSSLHVKGAKLCGEERDRERDWENWQYWVLGPLLTDPSSTTIPRKEKDSCHN